MFSNEAPTPQEEFWAGEEGTAYIGRNKDLHLLSSSIAMYADILRSTDNVSSALEFGANIGLNLLAIRKLLPDAELSALEINPAAVEELHKLDLKHVYHTSIFNYKLDYPRDLVFTRGVLIHLNPGKLKLAYAKLYDSARRYICVAEYYDPNPTMIPYHGEVDRLFKRDFAGELLDLYPNLRLVNYGFVYHRDPNFPQDDITWFLLEKKENSK